MLFIKEGNTSQLPLHGSTGCEYCLSYQYMSQLDVNTISATSTCLQLAVNTVSATSTWHNYLWIPSQLPVHGSTGCEYHLSYQCMAQLAVNTNSATSTRVNWLWILFRLPVHVSTDCEYSLSYQYMVQLAVNTVSATSHDSTGCEYSLNTCLNWLWILFKLTIHVSTGCEYCLSYQYMAQLALNTVSATSTWLYWQVNTISATSTWLNWLWILFKLPVHGSTGFEYCLSYQYMALLASEYCLSYQYMSSTGCEYCLSYPYMSSTGCWYCLCYPPKSKLTAKTS